MSGGGPQPLSTAYRYNSSATYPPGSELFLTAAHSAQAAQRDGELALGRLTYPAEHGRYDLVADYEVFPGPDLALLRCPGFNAPVLPLDFERLGIFQPVRTFGFGLGLDPEYLAYAPRGFAGHVVSGHQMFTWASQPFAYELSFAPPVGMSGAPLVPATGPVRVSAIVTGTAEIAVEGSLTRLGIAVSADELLRLDSRILGGPIATAFNRERLPPRAYIAPARDRELGLRSHQVDDMSD
jgi:hypothetical protein